MATSNEDRTDAAPPDQDADTRPTQPLPVASRTLPIHHNLPAGLTVARASHVGLKRRRNEDSFWVMNTELCGQGDTKPLALFLVADGLGGHENGDAASSMATRVVAGFVGREFLVPFLLLQIRPHDLPPIADVLFKAVEAANILVNRQLPDAGTTVTAAMVLENRAYVAHVGDSRAYLFDENGFRQVTRDHSLSAQMTALARTTGQDPPKINRNILYSAVGQGAGIQIDTHLLDLRPGACLLLCTDGLWDLVPDEEILHVLSISPTPKTAVQQLIAEANQRGGDDNVTAVLVVRAREQEPAPSADNA